MPLAATETPTETPDDDGPVTETHDGRHGPFFSACLVVGGAAIVFGIHGALSEHSLTNPGKLFPQIIALNLINDALAVPLVIGVAVVARRLLPRWLLLPFDAGLLVSAVVSLYAYPLVGSFAKSPAAGSSLLPWNYAHNLAIVLGVVWFGCALLAAWSWRRTRRSTISS